MLDPETFGTSQPAQEIAFLISQVEDERQREKLTGAVGRILSKSRRGFRLIEPIPEIFYRNRIATLWEKDFKAEVSNHPTISKYEEIQRLATIVIGLAAKRVRRGSETPNEPRVVQTGQVTTQGGPTSYLFVTNDYLLFAPSPKALRSLCEQHCTSMTSESQLEVIREWAEDALPGERIQFHEGHAVALGGNASDMRGLSPRPPEED